MSGCLNSSPYKMNNKNKTVNEKHHSQNPLEKKGIVSILSSDFSNTTTPKISVISPSPLNININSNSIRRTLSADMSSPKWLENNGFPLKKVQSSEKLQSLGEEEMNDKKGSSGGAAFDDIWSTILSQKKPDETGSGDQVYVHPLVKRASSLSEKSLEICTESLGSETGSDRFSFPSDHGEEPGPQPEPELDGDEVVEEMKSDYVEVGKYNYLVNKKKINSGVVTRSFPPPLPSLANRDDGSNLQMRTRREDGRLVLEAVSVPSRNCFRACREDGRLLLTLTNDNEEQEPEELNDQDIEDEIDEVIEDVEKKLAFVVENSCLPSTRMINVDKASSAMIMSKIMELTNTRNMSTWPRTSNRAVITSLDEGDEDMLEKQVEVQAVAAARQTVVQTLPPRQRVSTTTSTRDVLNAYEYYWRRSDSPTAAAVAVLKPLAGKQNNAINGVVSSQVVKDTNRINKFLLGHNLKGVPQEEMVLVKAATVGGEYLVPILKGCKEPRRSLYFLEPFCIATS